MTLFKKALWSDGWINHCGDDGGSGDDGSGDDCNGVATGGGGDGRFASSGRGIDNAGGGGGGGNSGGGSRKGGVRGVDDVGREKSRNTIVSAFFVNLEK